MISITASAAVIASLLLLVIVLVIAIRALPSLNLYFLLTPESDAPGFGNGIANAIAGTILISICSVVLASPIAIGTAIYMTKYSRNKTFTNILGYLIDTLSGTPSIVLGIFGLLFLVYYLKPFTGGFSLLSGSIALAILIMPVIEKSVEEAIKTVPSILEEGSYALGATKWDTIRCIIIPYSLAGIVTGIVLGIGRSAEESAVVMLTAGYTQFLPEFGIQANSKLLFGIQVKPFQDLVGILPVTVYQGYELGNLMPISNGFAAAFVLIVLVMLINAIARVILWRFKMNKSPATDSGGIFNLGGFFKKKGPGSSGSSLIPHISIFNRSKSDPIEKQMDSIFSELQNKPEKSDAENSIRPYFSDPLKDTPPIDEATPIVTGIIPVTEIVPNAIQRLPRRGNPLNR